MSENKFKTIAKIRRSWIYEGKMKSSSLSYNRRETRDKRPLGRDPDRSCCHRHTTNMKKAFLVAAHGSMGISGSIRARRKFLGVAFNQRETWVNRPLGRDPDRSWCHLHTSVKLFWSQTIALWTSTAAYECAAAQSMDPRAATKKALH